MATTARSSIVGAGLAGAKAAETLRDGGVRRPRRAARRGAAPPVRAAAAVQGLPAGHAPSATPCSCTRPDWYAEHDVDLRTRRPRSPAIDRGRARGRRSPTASGSATTSCCWPPAPSPRRLPVPGADLDGVHYLRTPRRQRPARARPSAGGRRVVVIGAGWIGLEVAAAARARGADGHRARDGRAAAAAGARRRDRRGLRRPAPRARRRPAASARRSREITRRRRPGRPACCWPTARDLPADAGRRRRRGHARTPSSPRRPGSTVDNGVVVDEHLRTSDPDIFAAGDVANAYHPLLGRHIRVEHWANALQPGRRSRPGRCSARTSSYDRLPYFFTDQYDLGMEYTGYVGPATTTEVVVRGDRRRPRVHRVLAGRRPGARRHERQRLGRHRRHPGARSAPGAPVDPARLADPAVPLDDLSGHSPA